jgi:hypothetical protein
MSTGFFCQQSTQDRLILQKCNDLNTPVIASDSSGGGEMTFHAVKITINVMNINDLA